MSSPRPVSYTHLDVYKRQVQEHKEREKDSYNNQDIVPERTALNVHYKAPTDDYVKMFEQMEQDGVKMCIRDRYSRSVLRTFGAPPLIEKLLFHLRSCFCK